MDLSFHHSQHRDRLRGPLADLAVGGLVVLALGILARQWLALDPAFLVWVCSLYVILAGVVFRAWLTRAPDMASPGGQSRNGLGWANRVTLARSVLIVLIAAVVPFPDAAQQHGWVLALVCLLALVLDGVDGMVARRTGTESAWGARFDMEMDAVFILALSMLMVSTGQAGLWVLLLGALRYVFLGAGKIWHWLQQPLPPSTRRQAICVWQVGTLLVCLLPVVPTPVVSPALLLALALLVMSFARDVWWLYQHQHQQRDVSRGVHPHAE